MKRLILSLFAILGILSAYAQNDDGYLRSQLLLRFNSGLNGVVATMDQIQQQMLNQSVQFNEETNFNTYPKVTIKVKQKKGNNWENVELYEATQRDNATTLTWEYTKKSEFQYKEGGIYFAVKGASQNDQFKIQISADGYPTMWLSRDQQLVATEAEAAEMPFREDNYEWTQQTGHLTLNYKIADGLNISKKDIEFSAQLVSTQEDYFQIYETSNEEETSDSKEFSVPFFPLLLDNNSEYPTILQYGDDRIVSNVYTKSQKFYISVYFDINNESSDGTRLDLKSGYLSKDGKTVIPHKNITPENRDELYTLSFSPTELKKELTVNVEEMGPTISLNLQSKVQDFEYGNTTIELYSVTEKGNNLEYTYYNSMTCDQNFEFSLADLPYGKYIAQIIADGYFPTYYKRPEGGIQGERIPLLVTDWENASIIDLTREKIASLYNRYEQDNENELPVEDNFYDGAYYYDYDIQLTPIPHTQENETEKICGKVTLTDNASLKAYQAVQLKTMPLITRKSTQQSAAKSMKADEEYELVSATFTREDGSYCFEGLPKRQQYQVTTIIPGFEPTWLDANAGEEALNFAVNLADKTILDALTGSVVVDFDLDADPEYIFIELYSVVLNNKGEITSAEYYDSFDVTKDEDSDRDEIELKLQDVPFGNYIAAISLPGKWFSYYVTPNNTNPEPVINDWRKAEVLTISGTSRTFVMDQFHAVDLPAPDRQFSDNFIRGVVKNIQQLYDENQSTLKSYDAVQLRRLPPIVHNKKAEAQKSFAAAGPNHISGYDFRDNLTSMAYVDIETGQYQLNGIDPNAEYYISIEIPGFVSEPLVAKMGDTNVEFEVYPADKTVKYSKTTAAESIFNDVKLEAYPNPAKDMIQVSGLPANAYTLYIFDAQGKMRLATQSNETTTTLNVAKLPAGIYFIRVQHAAGSNVFRFVKE